MDQLDIFISAHKDFQIYPHNNIYKIVTCKDTLKNKYEIQIIEEDYHKYTPIRDAVVEFSRMWFVHNNIPVKRYVGFCQYRRYFDFYDNIPSVETLFKTNDVIVSNPLNTNMRKQYGQCHNINDYNKIREIIMDLYKVSEEEMCMYEQSIIPHSIFIMADDMFHQYCEFVSSIFDEYIKFNKFETYNDVLEYVKNNRQQFRIINQSSIELQSRIMGFLNERISTIFFKKYFKNIGYRRIIMK